MDFVYDLSFIFTGTVNTADDHIGIPGIRRMAAFVAINIDRNIRFHDYLFAPWAAVDSAAIDSAKEVSFSLIAYWGRATLSY